MMEKATGNPWFDAWAAASDVWMASLNGQDEQLSQSARDAFSAWRVCERQAQEWWQGTQALFTGGLGSGGLGGSGEGDVAAETLRRMMDPSRFLTAGTDEVNLAIQRLVEGPEFADIGVLERHVLKASAEWLALREASAAYRQVTAKAWMRVYRRFTEEVTIDPAMMSHGARALLDRWLELANEELIDAQRSEEFLEAQRRLLAAGVSYRLKERTLVEMWCESHSMPTRTEIDDMQETIHALRTELRDLRRRLAVVDRPADGEGKTGPERKSGARRKAGAVQGGDDV